MKCLNCKKEIDDDSLFCEYCGTRVEKKSKKWLWVGIALALVVVGINSLTLLIEYFEEKEMLEHQEYIAQQQAIEEQRVADSLALVAQQQAEEAARQAEISRRKEAERQAELKRQREAERKKTELLKSFYVDLGLPSGTWWGKTNAGGGYLYTYDEAVSKFGSELPTKTQFEELKNYCTWTWTTQNGVNGRKVTGPNGNSIFLPAAGSRYCDGRMVLSGLRGWYWSSTPDDSDSAWNLAFDSRSFFMRSNDCCEGLSLRLVKNF
ncbi:MAG: zinc-ribbon domain-containing protein [Paludibacteraceae bacterium]|nr:zinc-ribbon domain-containing protein [Paludibacteraceae bacterium]